MSTILITSIIAITLALILYTIGVWTEHKAKILKWRHFVFFVLGFVADTTGTLAMSTMADRSAKTAGPAIISLHGLTGALAIAFICYFRNRNRGIDVCFHRIVLTLYIAIF